jgi:hypothetical protein
MQLFNPENSGIGPGLERLNPGISGLEKRPGSRDFGIPGLETLFAAVEAWRISEFE